MDDDQKKNVIQFQNWPPLKSLLIFKYFTFDWTRQYNIE